MENKKYEVHKSSLGMDANLLAMIVYGAGIIISIIPFLDYFGWIGPLVFYFLEKDSKLVKFHAVQSSVLYIIDAVLSLILTVLFRVIFYSIYTASSLAGATIIVSILSFINLAIGITITVFAVISIVKAYNYEEYRIPLLGDWAVKFESILAKNNINNKDTNE